MSKSGVGGRGRGWLHLNKNQNAAPNPAPIQVADNPKNITVIGDESKFTDVNEHEFKDLISKIREIKVTDDGIKFNQKIKYILENWKQDCQNSEEVERSFDALYQGCLNDEELASKLVVMVSSRSFISQEVHDQNIRLIFLKKLQNDFEGCKIVSKANPTAFRNGVRMLGEFFHKARLVNGQPFTFMLTPLLSYLEMLLESAHALDLQQFTFQIFLNGAAIKTEYSDKLAELFNKTRMFLTSDKKISKEGKLWLLLSLEIYNNKFGMLPIEVFKFYQEQLGGSAMAGFQGTQHTLSVQTPEDNKTLENYQSNVNVLQLSTKPDVTTDQSNSAVSYSDTTNSSCFISDSSSHNNSSNSIHREKSKTQNSGSSSTKCGRPILGVGARLNKSKSNDSSNWRDRDNTTNSSGWGKKSGWGDGDKNSKGKKKGWEHDDRFENDYS
ncbi:uncharacterized protein LOC130901784 [Diorhabda carinulata]|uniref:uncharacterized protein LOC130901784 n=1 Tax=Diorhabda carinulata TaxID=1163345 RepID=UPI0025A0F354|nr:uncharacterized protein LOC130901784 [Diorhabda carinulata]